MEIRKPRRVQHTYTQSLVADLERVLPLLCPVREVEWIEEWNPKLVLTDSGVAEVDCVFLLPTEDGADAIWYITQHDRDLGLVEMIKITPEVTACKLTIRLTQAVAGCEATVTYCHTSLGPKGDAFLETFTEASYVESMQRWEARLNHFLETGTMLVPEDA